MSSDKNTLRGLIYAHFGGYQQLALHLQLSTSTVSQWVHTTPRNLLKYLPEVCRDRQLSYEEVINAVEAREQEIE